MPTAQQVYHMLGNDNLWEAAATCHDLLRLNGLAHAICGGVAVCLHGYQRNTVDLDLLIRPDDAKRIREILIEAGMEWDAKQKEFHSPSGIIIQFLIAGERAGKDSEARLPDPSLEAMVTAIDRLPVLALPRLIETKLACGEGDIRRTHKDFADVVELIAIHHLDSSFARFLHKSLRKTFRSLVRNARGSG